MVTEKVQPWTVGDPCPACGADLAPYRPATPEEYAAAFDKENPKTLLPRVDSAPPAFVAEHGQLHVCDCGYQSRVLPEAAADDPPPKKGAKTKTSTGE